MGFGLGNGMRLTRDRVRTAATQSHRLQALDWTGMDTLYCLAHFVVMAVLLHGKDSDFHSHVSTEEPGGEESFTQKQY